MRTIISTSGGLDSTYVLWKILSTTSDEVTAVFLDTNSIDPILAQNKYDIRWLQSSNTINSTKNHTVSICDWLKENVRDFTLEIHTVDSTKFRKGLDVIDRSNSINGYFTDMAIERINSNQIDRIVSSNERENDGFSHGGTKNGIRRPGAMEFRDRFVSYATRGQIDFMLTDMNYTQANALIELPQELMDKTISCDAVLDNLEPCGVCFKCKKRKFFCDAIDEGKTAQEIYDIVEAKSVQGDGTWLSMKYWINGNTEPTWPMPQWPSSYAVTI